MQVKLKYKDFLIFVISFNSGGRKKNYRVYCHLYPVTNKKEKKMFLLKLFSLQVDINPSHSVC